MLDTRILLFPFVVFSLTACNSPSETGQASALDVAVEAEHETNWTVLPDESHIKFSALQQGKKFEGEFTDYDAAILFDADRLEESQVTVRVRLMSAEAGDQERNETLKSKAWFATKSFPVATFVGSNFTSTGNGTYVVKGPLSIKGVKREIEFPFSLESVGSGVDGKTLMTATISLDRTEWSIGEDPWNTEEWVSQEVYLNLQVTAIPK